MNANSRIETMTSRMQRIEEELELKSGENNRLRIKVAEQEKTVQDLYLSRKGDAALQVEIEQIKTDNGRLMGMLRLMPEFADMNDNEITKQSRTGATNRSKSSSGRVGGGKKALNQSSREANSSTFSSEWIPNEAVRAINRIKAEFKSQMTETCVSQILYELNTIWRDLMRKECDSIKRRMTSTIQDLRRQLVTKKAFDQEDASKEISKLKKELIIYQKQANSMGQNKRQNSSMAMERKSPL
jgi:hypothetical protein